MAPPDQPPDVPNAFVDQSVNPVTLTKADGSTMFTPPVLFRAYAEHNIDLHNGRTGRPVPVGYNEFAGRWNKDQNCSYWFSTFNPATAVITTVGAPFPAGFLDSIDPPPALRAPTLPTTFEYTAGQNNLIQHMLWSTAHRESYFEKKREATRTKRTDDRRSKHEEYRARDSAMGRPRTPSKAPVAVPAAAAAANPITCGSGTSTAATATATALNSAAPSIPIAGPSNLGNPAAPLVLPLVAPVPSGSSTTAAAPPPRAPSPMQEDEPEAPAGINPTLTIWDESVLNFTEDGLINFSDVEDEVPLAAGKGKGKKMA